MLIDVSIFQDELALLEIRLNELDGIVDQFVLIEMPVDLFGKEKPYVSGHSLFEAVCEKFKNKIKVIRLSKAPRGNSEESCAQRYRAAIDAVNSFTSVSDILIFSEVWRIPKANVIMDIAPSLDSNCLLGTNSYWWSFWGEGPSDSGVFLGKDGLTQDWLSKRTKELPCICDAGWALRGFRDLRDVHLEFRSGPDKELWGFPPWRARMLAMERKDAFGDPIHWTLPRKEEVPTWAWENKDAHLSPLFSNYLSGVGKEMHRRVHEEIMSIALV
jgi:hypothetical protein